MKYLAVLMISLLLVSGLYAEINVSGSVGGGITFIKGTNLNGDLLQTGSYLSGSILAEGIDENDNFGGTVEINAEASTIDPAAWAWTAAAWWKPFYFMKVQAGYIDDFALTDIVGWGYHANDAESYVISPLNNYAGDYFSDTTGFYSGTGNGWMGFSLSVTPFYGLDINLAVPFGTSSTRIDKLSPLGDNIKDPLTGNDMLFYKAEDAYLHTSAQIAYTLWGVGRLAFCFVGGGNGELVFPKEVLTGDDFTPESYDPTAADQPDGIMLYSMLPNAHSIYGSFFLTAFEDKGFSANLGVAYTLPSKTSNKLITYNAPMEVGLGLSFGTDQFGIKTRMAASFLGYAYRSAYGSNPASGILYEPLMVGLGILPYAGFGPFMFYLNAGVSYKTEDQYMNDGDGKVYRILDSDALGWYANPYMTLSIGSGRFYFGIHAESDGVKYLGFKQETVTISTVKGDGMVDSMPGRTVIDWGISAGILFEF
ncbi:MAG: hypothetical protein FWD78_16595 [Treponema sp.]|nr:hypothetical protein [Treponema sp.]